MNAVPRIEINLDDVHKGLILCIAPRKKDTLFDECEVAAENNEARFQLVEGCQYDYEINYTSYTLGDIGENIIQQHKLNPNLGTISPNIFVGTLQIPLIEAASKEKRTDIELEVQSIKTGYRNDYRDMLELITEKCTDLLLQANSPVSHHFEIDYTKDSQTLYQRFSFIKYILNTEEFADAVHRIVTAPATRWAEISESKDIRNAKRISNAGMKEILKGGNRTKLPETHYLKKYGLESLPEKISSIRKTDSVDTPENRFIKHALETFLKFCTEIGIKAKEFGHAKIQNEAEILIRELSNQLHHSFFKTISRPTTLKLNSPVLQRKEGYREVLRVWLMFDFAAKLIWTGGDDVYGAGKKDIAALYEYWLFFKLLDLCQNIFSIDPVAVSELIKSTDDGLSLQIKQGKSTPLSGVYDSGSRKLNVRFNYNRQFSGNSEYPDSGSWTTTLRPDYTLSFWPYGLSEEESEKQELIVHVHFDAKYKVANLTNFLDNNPENNLDEEKKENRKGIYKNADLLKMHGYRDAIRRTGGAYVLYPGGTHCNKQGFHEIIPGLGAFPIRPSKTDNGIDELKTFILEVINHFINRASQREKMAFRTYDIYKNPPGEDSAVRESLPESYGANRDLIPDDTYVLIGFYNSPDHFKWVKSSRLYNFRMGSGKGSLMLSPETVGAKFLLLHTSGDKDSGNLWRIVSKGPKVYSKKDLEKKNYPSPSRENYLVIKLEPVNDSAFANVRWNFKKLANFAGRRSSSFPFTASLSELMKYKVIEQHG